MNQDKAAENTAFSDEVQRDCQQSSNEHPTVVAEPMATDPELAKVVAAWSCLSEPIRRAMLALISCP